MHSLNTSLIFATFCATLILLSPRSAGKLTHQHRALLYTSGIELNVSARMGVEFRARKSGETTFFYRTAKPLRSEM